MSFYRQLLRWAALPVTDRRWAAPLAALALGFGLFVGIALGPGTASTVATGVSQIIEEVPPAADGGEGRNEIAEADGESTGAESSGGFEEEGGFEETESGLGETGFEFEEVEPEAGGEPFAETAPTPPAEPEEEQDGEEEGQPVFAAGTVVHVNPAAGSYTLVEAGGTLAAVHAPKLPKAGIRLSVPVRMLANGTFAEAGVRRKTGSKARASFSGIVTYVDPDPAAPAYSVSKRGVSVLVNVRPDPAGAVPVLPAVGAYAVVAVEIETLPPTSASAAEAPPAEPALPPGAAPPPAPPAPLCDGVPLAPPTPPQPVARLWQAELDAEGVPFAYSDFAGIVTAVCPQEGRLYLSADDLRAGGADLVFAVPKGIRTDRLRPGDSVTATATIEADGTLKLTGLAADEHTKGADDAEATQGDLVDHNEE